MTDPNETKTLDPLPVAEMQRRMLVGFAAAILIMVAVQVVIPLIWLSRAEDMDAPATLGSIEIFLYLAQVFALAVFLVPAFRLIPWIGWSALNQLAFVAICVISFGCGPLLLLALFLINQQANRILRSHDVAVGFLGASRQDIDRMREARSEAQV